MSWLNRPLVWLASRSESDVIREIANAFVRNKEDRADIAMTAISGWTALCFSEAVSAECDLEAFWIKWASKYSYLSHRNEYARFFKALVDRLLKMKFENGSLDSFIFKSELFDRDTGPLRAFLEYSMKRLGLDRERLISLAFHDENFGFSAFCLIEFDAVKAALFSHHYNREHPNDTLLRKLTYESVNESVRKEAPSRLSTEDRRKAFKEQLKREAERRVQDEACTQACLELIDEVQIVTEDYLKHNFKMYETDIDVVRLKSYTIRNDKREVIDLFVKYTGACVRKICPGEISAYGNWGGYNSYSVWLYRVKEGGYAHASNEVKG